MKMTVEFEIDTNTLTRASDAWLAAQWAIVQHGPTPYGDPVAEKVTSAIGFEIIRRWLGNVPPELYHHQQGNNSHKWLTTFARYEPPAGVRPNIDGNDDGEWHRGTWVAKDADTAAAGGAS